MKKFILTIFIILFFISIYKDLTIGTDISQNSADQIRIQTITETESLYDVVKIKVNSGDTLLTIVERLNPNMSQLNIEHILKDFSSLNPNVDPNKLQTNRFYFFPKYKQK